MSRTDPDEKVLDGVGEGGEGVGFEGAEHLAGGGGDVASEGFHAGGLREDCVGAEGLGEALDGGGGEDVDEAVAVGMLAGIVAQEAGLLGCGEVGVGVAEEAGEVVGNGAAAHTLVIYHDGLIAAEKDVAGLPIAVD